MLPVVLSHHLVEQSELLQKISGGWFVFILSSRPAWAHLGANQRPSPVTWCRTQWTARIVAGLGVWFYLWKIWFRSTSRDLSAGLWTHLRSRWFRHRFDTVFAVCWHYARAGRHVFAGSGLLRRQAGFRNGIFQHVLSGLLPRGGALAIPGLPALIGLVVCGGLAWRAAGNFTGRKWPALGLRRAWPAVCAILERGWGLSSGGIWSGRPQDPNAWMAWNLGTARRHGRRSRSATKSLALPVCL